MCCTKAFTPPDPYDCLDLFSGERAISKAFAAKKLRSCELDIAHDPRDETCHAYFSSYSYIICACKLHMSCRFLVAYKDILSPGGFCRFLWAAMNLKENGLMVAGIKCSTWSIVNSGLAACWFHWCSNVDYYIFLLWSYSPNLPRIHERKNNGEASWKSVATLRFFSALGMSLNVH